MDAHNTKRRQKPSAQKQSGVTTKDDSRSKKRYTFQTKTVKDILKFTRNAAVDEYSAYGQSNKNIMLSTLLPLFQRGVLAKLTSADIRVDDPDYINGNLITADFLLHVDIDKFMQAARKLYNTSYPGIMINTISRIKPIDCTDVMCLTIVFKRKPYRGIVDKAFDIFFGFNNKTYDIKHSSYDITAALCFGTENDDGSEKTSLSILKFNDDIMRMNFKKLLNSLNSYDLSSSYGKVIKDLFIQTGIKMEQVLYDTVNRRLNRDFEQDKHVSAVKRETRRETTHSLTATHEYMKSGVFRFCRQYFDHAAQMCKNMKAAFIKWISE